MKRALELNETTNSVDTQALWDAVKAGDLETIKKLVPSQFPFDVENDNDNSIILFATQCNHLHIVKWCVENDKDYINTDYSWAISDALEDGNMELANFLVDHIKDSEIWGGNRVNILSCAVIRGDLEFFKKVYSKLEYSRDHIVEAFKNAVVYKKREIFEFLLSDRVKKPNWNIVEVLEACNIAASMNDMSTIRMVFEKYGQPVPLPLMSAPITAAAQFNHIDMLGYLIKFCDRRVVSHLCQDALLYASNKGHYQAVDFLLQNGVKVGASRAPHDGFARDLSGLALNSTGVQSLSIDAVIAASLNKRWNIVHLLLDHDNTYQSHDGIPLRCAIMDGNVQIARMLFQRTSALAYTYNIINGAYIPTYEFHKLAFQFNHFHCIAILPSFPDTIFSSIVHNEEVAQQYLKYNNYMTENKLYYANPAVLHCTEYKMKQLDNCKKRNAASFLEMYLCMPEVPTEVIAKLQSTIYDIEVGAKGISQVELPTVEEVKDAANKLEGSSEGAIRFAAMCKKNALAI